MKEGRAAGGEKVCGVLITTLEMSVTEMFQVNGSPGVVPGQQHTLYLRTC